MARISKSVSGRIRGREGRRGGALVMALVAVMVVASLSAAFMQFSSAVTKRQVGAIEKKKAFYMAEAGLTEAFAGLWGGKSGNVGSSANPATFGDGVFWVEATELAATSMVRLESTGMVGGGSAVLSLVAEQGEYSVASLGVFAGEQLTLQPGSTIDGYDSRKGSYEDQAAADELSLGRLGSNGAIQAMGTAEDPTVINGDLTPGPEETVQITGDVTISGSTEPRLVPVELPAVTPLGFESTQSVDHNGRLPLIVGAGSSGMDTLIVRDGSEVVLQGPATLEVANLLVEDGAQLTFDPTAGPITIVVTDGLELADGCDLVFGCKDTTGVTLKVAGTPASPVVVGTDHFNGTLYAPEADVVVTREIEVFGSLVGRNVDFVAPAHLHFDAYLEALAAAEALPSLVSWRILELNADSALAGQNPMDILGLTPGDMRPPADSHEDQWLDLTYMSGGAMNTYSGMEGAFDWTTVDSVVEGRRDGELFAQEGVVDPTGLVRDLLAFVGGVKGVATVPR